MQCRKKIRYCWFRNIVITCALVTGSMVSHSSLQAREAPPFHDAAKSSNTEQKLLPVVNQEDIHLNHQLIADNTLRRLPKQCQKALRALYVRYDHPKHRGLSSTNTIILDGSEPDEEFRALFIHEFGHITDLGCLTGTTESPPSTFRDGNIVMKQDDPSVGFYAISWTSEKIPKELSTPADFVSGYATSDVFEDFAETYAYYILQPEAFAARARWNTVLAQKREWMLQNVFEEYKSVAS